MSKCHRVQFFWDTNRQVDTVAMETTQPVPSQFKNFLTTWIENWIRSLCANKIISEHCELVKLCRINCGGPFFWDIVYIVFE